MKARQRWRQREEVFIPADCLFLPTVCCHTVDKHYTHSSPAAKSRDTTACRLTRALAKTKAVHSTFCSKKAETKAGRALLWLVHFGPMRFEVLTAGADKDVCFDRERRFYSILVSCSLNHYQSKMRNKLHRINLLLVILGKYTHMWHPVQALLERKVPGLCLPLRLLLFPYFRVFIFPSG